ncbi:hypothetical protein CCACVL1_11540 [Corchorus capsularis]|uniref:Cellular retinaldehyde binding/alpha-tocopherol transport n=1 Tax=Corchorus capsularis TaxID=210143 RepID=A0A1R3IKT3_COCAP|nr:hypothetical protein CCACVL1_11540 [Corchorus capsularis]
MAVEVKVEETQAAEVVIPQEEPKKVAKENEKVVHSEEAVKVDDSVPKTVGKSSSYREESNFLSDLKEFEKKALINKDISLWGVPLLPSKGGEATDVVLLKLLRAREFKVNDALQMLENILQWRKENNIDSILEEDFGVDLASASYMNGTDKEGHPICYNICGVFENEELYKETFGTEEKRGKFLRWRFQLMEKGIQKLDLKPGGVTSLLQINDLKNSPAPSRKEIRIVLKQIVAALQDNYPEFVARNIFINVPFWFYALNALLSPFLTQRSKSKFVVARPAKVTETLLKYIPAEEVPIQYGGFKKENDYEFCGQDAVVSEVLVKAGSTATIEIPADEVGCTSTWELIVLGWEVNYKAEFVPTDEGSYTVIVQKSKKIVAQSQEGPLRNNFRNNEPGKLVLTVENTSSKKKRLLYRYKTK